MKYAVSTFSIIALAFLSSCASKDQTAVERIEHEITSSSGSLSKGIELATAEIEKGTSDPWIYTHRAQAYISKGQLENAQNDLAKARTLGLKKDIDLMMQAQIAMKLNDYDTAARLAAQVEKMNPKAQTPAKMKEAAYKRALQVQLAFKELSGELEKAQSIQEKAFLTANLARLEYYNMFNAKEKAITRLEEFLKVNPNESNVSDTLAWFMLMNGKNPKKALETALENVKKYPESCIYNDTLAAAYAANGDFEKALETLEKTLKLLPYPLPSTLYAMTTPIFELKKEAYTAERPWSEAPQQVRAVWYIPDSFFEKKAGN